MDANPEQAFDRLSNNLNEMIGLYRSLLETIRQEADLLIKADIEKLNQINKEKENLLFKIRALDLAREKYAKDLAKAHRLDLPVPRLLELARQIGGVSGDQLRNYHATLDLLLNRVAKLNRQNEDYTKSALETLSGALSEIKGTLAGKPTYGQKGKMTVGPEKAGNFISKEA